MAWKYKSNAKAVKESLIKGTATATRTTARAISKGGSRRAPKRTGALKASMYVVDATPTDTGGGKSGFAQAKNDAIAANPHVAHSIEPEISLPRPPVGVLRCAVASAVAYAGRIERGSYGGDDEGYQGGRAYLKPSADEQEPKLEQRVAAAIAKVEARKKL